MRGDTGTRSSTGDLRRRLIRHYVPLTLASAVVLVTFMNISFFDANRYPPPGEIFAKGVSGAFPEGNETAAMPPAGNGGSQASPFQHAPGQTGPPPGMNHGAGQSGPPSAAGGAVDSADPSMQEHAGDPQTVLRMRRLSTGTGYLTLGLLGLTLLIGPANLLLGRRTPVSSYLRRDVGIATAIGSVVHMIFGFLVKHGDGQVLSYFLEPDDRAQILTTSFGLANWAGLIAVIIVAGLAVISSDTALRKLKARRWKRIQRLTYVLFALVVVHAVLYGALWRKTSPYTVMLGLSVIAVAAGQAMGVLLWRRRKTRTPAPATA